MSQVHVYDAVVFGGTPSGVAAALTIARRGHSVCLISCERTVGGMMSNGLCASDIGSKFAISGVAKEFFERVGAHYPSGSPWRFEPHVAESIFKAMLCESGVDLVLGEDFIGVSRDVSKVNSIRTLSGEFFGKNFVDASYAGDLFAAAGCQFNLGMRDYLSYDESLARKRGVPKILDMDCGAEVARANPFIRVLEKVRIQEGMPSFTYRLCLAKGRGAVRFEPGPHYGDQREYFRCLLAGYIKRDAGRAERLDVKENGTLHSSFYQLAMLQNGKYDLNSGWASFTNCVTDGAYFSRPEIREARNRQLAEFVGNFFHFVQSESCIPYAIRSAFTDFGLASDEFSENGNWPWIPYLREGRRVVGRYTLTERDIFESRVKRGSVALGAYPIDSKLTQLVFRDGAVYRDMGPHVRVPMYEIPYWSMVPAAGVHNLVVSVGVSASPVAYGSLRMEPQFIALGEAAGVAIAMALEEKGRVWTLSPRELQEELIQQGRVVKVKPASSVPD